MELIPPPNCCSFCPNLCSFLSSHCLSILKFFALSLFYFPYFHSFSLVFNFLSCLPFLSILSLSIYPDSRLFLLRLLAPLPVSLIPYFLNFLVVLLPCCSSFYGFPTCFFFLNPSIYPTLLLPTSPSSLPP